MPNMGVDSIIVLAHIVIGLQEIQSRELGRSDGASLTFGSIHAGDAVCYAKALLGDDAVCTATEFAERLDGNVPRVMGSEDFAYVSHEIPAVMVSLAAGNASSGYAYPQHHPMVTFDERVMVNGAAVYAYTALCWLPIINGLSAPVGCVAPSIHR